MTIHEERSLVVNGCYFRVYLTEDQSCPQKSAVEHYPPAAVVSIKGDNTNNTIYLEDFFKLYHWLIAEANRLLEESGFEIIFKEGGGYNG